VISLIRSDLQRVHLQRFTVHPIFTEGAFSAAMHPSLWQYGRGIASGNMILFESIKYDVIRINSGNLIVVTTTDSRR